MLTKKDKADLIEMLKNIDPKTLDIQHENQSSVKWYRFGGYMGLRIACDIINALPEQNEPSTVS